VDLAVGVDLEVLGDAGSGITEEGVEVLIHKMSWSSSQGKQTWPNRTTPPFCWAIWRTWAVTSRLWYVA
jgi:hypothetical protein